MPKNTVYHLQKIKSDHRPLAIWCGKENGRRHPHPFHFLSGWLSHNGFRQLVHENWGAAGMLEESVKNFVTVVKKWNIKDFGNILKRKRTLLA